MHKKILFNKFGYTIVEVLFVASLLGAIPMTVYIQAEKSARSVECISNMKNIYIGIQLYESDFERLPDAKFYPDNPKDDPKSIVNILGKYIDDKNVFLCPSMPDELKKKGLTYIWNDGYNNQFSDTTSEKSLKWLLTDMTAIDEKIPPPHSGSYNVLFLDGHAEAIKERVEINPVPAKLKKGIEIFFAGNLLPEKEKLAKKDARKISMYPRCITL